MACVTARSDSHCLFVQIIAVSFTWLATNTQLTLLPQRFTKLQDLRNSSHWIVEGTLVSSRFICPQAEFRSTHSPNYVEIFLKTHSQTCFFPAEDFKAPSSSHFTVTKCLAPSIPSIPRKSLNYSLSHLPQASTYYSHLNMHLRLGT